MLARAGAAERADRLLQEALAGLRDLGDVQLMAQAQNILGLLFVDQDRPAEALGVLTEGIARWRNVANQWGLSFGLRYLAEAHVASGHVEPAEAALEESDRLWIAVGSRWGRAMVWRTRTGRSLTERDFAGARRSGSQVLQFSRGLGDRLGAAETAELCARLRAGEGAWEEAARAIGCADGLREAAGSPRPPLSLRLLGPAADETRAALGDPRFEQVRAATASLSPAVLLDRALEIGR